jgi:outer membrane protein OmpA-like peptidoglycan-associated protein
MSRQLIERESESDDQWVSISDMMSGLMVIFLFIAISYMIHISNEKERIEEVAVVYNRLRTDLYEELNDEFRQDFARWNAEIHEQDLSIRFRGIEVLFAQGRDDVRPEFKSILNDFFPRYIEILRKPKFLEDISEIRIEGHTSSEWITGLGAEAAYIRNMELSQSRTRKVLEHVLLQSEIGQDDDTKAWVRQYLTANGLSSSKLIMHESGTEDIEASRRVEFRVRTNAEKRIVEIINRGSGF